MGGLLTQLVNVLESPDAVLARFVLKKVHSFLSVSPRLLDVRGRNGWLVTSRKILSLLLSKVFDMLGCNSYVLRYGGNEVRVLGVCGEKTSDAVSSICMLSRHLVDLYSYMVSPASLRFSLEKSCKDELCSWVSLGDHNIDVRLNLGRLEGSRVVCNICGDAELGVDPEQHLGHSRLVAHIARDERSLCVRDLFYRLLGRTLNSPTIFSIVQAYDGSRVATSCPPDPDAVCSVFDAEDGGFGAKLWFRAYRHPVDGCPACVLDDVMRIGVEVEVGGRTLGVEYTIVGLRVVKDFVEELKGVLKGESVEISRSPRSVPKDMLWSVAEGFAGSRRIEELVERFVKKLRDNISYCRSCRGARFNELVEHLSNLLAENVVVHVMPVLWPKAQPDRAVDLELTMVNLGGEVEVLDLDSIAFLSQTNAVVFIRGDGDRFGTLTTPGKLYRAVGERIEGLRRAFDAIGLDKESLIYAWDYMIEKHMQKYLKNTLLLELLLGGKLLVVYVGGDENLFIVPVEGNTPYERARILLERIEVFRELLLRTIAEPIASVANCNIAEVVKVLENAKIGTLTSANVITSPKFPSYLAVSVLDEGLEVSKEFQRDTIFLHTLTSIEVEWVSRRWIEEAIASLLPTWENVSKKVARAYRVFYLSSELIDVVKGVLDYCTRKKLEWRECLDEISATIDTVYASLETLFGPLREITRSIASLGIPRPGYTSFELMKHIERGVG